MPQSCTSFEDCCCIVGVVTTSVCFCFVFASVYLISLPDVYR
jgi:hypothetical protein